MLQFSGQSAEDMKKTYAEFCSCHLKALKLYKELLTRDKKFQSFIRVRNLPILSVLHSPVEKHLWKKYSTDSKNQAARRTTRRAEGKPAWL